MEEIDDLESVLVMVCSYAVKDHPQMFEKVGILVLSKGYRRQNDKKKEDGAA